MVVVVHPLTAVGRESLQDHRVGWHHRRPWEGTLLLDEDDPEGIHCCCCYWTAVVVQVVRIPVEVSRAHSGRKRRRDHWRAVQGRVRCPVSCGHYCSVVARWLWLLLVGIAYSVQCPPVITSWDHHHHLGSSSEEGAVVVVVVAFHGTEAYQTCCCYCCCAFLLHRGQVRCLGQSVARAVVAVPRRSGPM